jgi:hypothetical protein
MIVYVKTFEWEKSSHKQSAAEWLSEENVKNEDEDITQRWPPLARKVIDELAKQRKKAKGHSTFKRCA